ncbi:MAG: hypothetical protein DRP79_03165 [Planctomycetota bacterium]|nr:MAG: hypothetical protein DRP79_03165 [Planctomycetota bacterium]
MNKGIFVILAVAVLAGCASAPRRRPSNDPHATGIKGAEMDIAPPLRAREFAPKPQIRLLNFTSGGEYFGGSKQVVMWEIEGEYDDWDMVELLVSRDSGRQWYSIGRVPASKGQVVWTLPTTEGSGYRLTARLIRETDVLSEWLGETDFGITCGLPPCLPVVDEVSVEHTVTVTYRIAPRHADNEREIGPEDLAKVVLWVTSNDGETWQSVGAFPADGKGINYTAADGRYGFVCVYATRDGAWSATPHPGATPQAAVVIDATPPTLEIRSPAEGEEIPVPEKDWADGGRVHIVWDVWDANLGDETVNILVTQDGKEWRSLGETLAASGAYETRLKPSDEPYRLKLVTRDIAGNETAVRHRKGFRVVRRPGSKPDEAPTLTLVRPCGGEVFRGGSDQTVIWKSTGLPESKAGIIAEFFDGEAWHEIRRLSDPCGTFVWRVPGANGDCFRLRLRVDLKYRVLTAQSGLLTVDSAPPRADIVLGAPDVEEGAEKPVTGRVKPVEPEGGQCVPARGPQVADSGPVIEAVINIGDPMESGPRQMSGEPPAEDRDAADATPRWHEVEEETERLAKRRMIDEAFEYIDKEQWTMAEMALGRLLKKYPGDVEALYGMGRLYYDQGRYEDASEYLHKVVGIEPTHAAAQYYLGKIAMRSDAPSITEKEVRRTIAEMRFKEAIGNDPTMARAYNDLAALYFEEKRYEKALENFGRAVDADPVNKIYLYNYARAAYELRKYEDVVDFCLKAIKIDVSFPHPYWFIAKTYSEQGKWDKAVEYWQRAVDLFGFDKRLQAEAVRRLKEAREHLN